MNRRILLVLPYEVRVFLATGLIMAGNLSAQERSAGKDTFVDPGEWVNETVLPETNQDRAAREAKDKTWVDPGMVVDTTTTRNTGNNMQTPIIVGTFGSYFTYTNTQNTANFNNAYVGRPTNDVFYRFTLNVPMEVELKHCGSALSDTYLSLLNSAGTYIAHNDDYSGPGQCSSTLHSYLKINLAAGKFIVGLRSLHIHRFLHSGVCQICLPRLFHHEAEIKQGAGCTIINMSCNDNFAFFKRC